MEIRSRVDGLDRQLSKAFYASRFALARSFLTRGDIVVLY
jgi:hypothetical protein